MRKLPLLLTFFLFISFLGCKKHNEVQLIDNSDITSKIFRIIVQSDAKFNIELVELHGDNITRDTLNLSYNATTQFSYGYKPYASSKLTVKVLSPNSTNFSCIFLYKGVKVGPDSIIDTPDGKEADVVYTVGL